MCAVTRLVQRGLMGVRAVIYLYVFSKPCSYHLFAGNIGILLPIYVLYCSISNSH